MFVHVFLCLSVNPCVYLFIRSSIHPSVCLSVRPSMCSPISVIIFQSIRLSVSLSACLSLYLRHSFYLCFHMSTDCPSLCPISVHWSGSLCPSFYPFVQSSVSSSATEAHSVIRPSDCPTVCPVVFASIPLILLADLRSIHSSSEYLAN